MLDLINILDDFDFCTDPDMGVILRIVGIVVFGIKIVVPIILILVGMLDLAKAVSAKKEDDIKNAQNALIKKAIAAVLVFLVATIVSLLMGVVNGRAYKECMDCIDHPFSNKCKAYQIDNDGKGKAPSETGEN